MQGVAEGKIVFEVLAEHLNQNWQSFRNAGLSLEEVLGLHWENGVPGVNGFFEGQQEEHCTKAEPCTASLFPGQDWEKELQKDAVLVGGRKPGQCSISNLEKQKLVKTIKSCREIDKERRIIGIRAQKGIVNFQACSLRCVKGDTSRIRIQEEQVPG